MTFKSELLFNFKYGLLEGFFLAFIPIIYVSTIIFFAKTDLHDPDIVAIMAMTPAVLVLWFLEYNIRKALR